MDALDTFKVGRLTVKIYQDEDAESPREWDNLGTMVCWHRRYNLGDDGVGSTGKRESRQFDSPADFEEFRDNKANGVVVCLPLGLLDHSGITMWVGNGPHWTDSAGWDSGQVGWIFATRETIRKEYGCKRITRKLLAKVEDVLRQEVKTYDEYLTGEVYGYDIEDEHGESVDSCWGFFGAEYVKQEARSQAEYFANRSRWLSYIAGECGPNGGAK